MSTTTWNFDLAHSALRFSVRHMMFSKVHGSFGSWRGELRYDSEALAASGVSVEVDIESIDTGNADRDNHLRSPDFFDAAQFPTMRFASERLEERGDDGFVLHGALTLRGVTLPLALEARKEGEGRDPWGLQRVAFSAKGKLSRKAFGLQWNQALETGGVLVGDEIEIALDVQATRQP